MTQWPFYAPGDMLRVRGGGGMEAARLWVRAFVQSAGPDMQGDFHLPLPWGNAEHDLGGEEVHKAHP